MLSSKMASAFLAKLKNSSGDGRHHDHMEPLKSDMLHTKSSLPRWMPLDRCQKRHLHLYSHALECYGDSNGQKYAKGSFPLKDLKVVETADDEVLDMPFTFQVLCEKNQETQAWYFACHLRLQQEEWVREIRKAAKAEKAMFWEKYHPGSWKKDKWSCCMRTSRDAQGCRNASVSGHAPSFPSVDVTARRGLDQPSQEVRTNAEHGRKQRNTRKVVIAKTDFAKDAQGDFTIKKGVRYEVVDDGHDVWWTVKSPDGKIGPAPRNCLVESDDTDESSQTRDIRNTETPIQRMAEITRNNQPHQNGVQPTSTNPTKEELTTFEWYFGKPPRELVDPILKSTRTDGCFLVRDSSTVDGYVLSVYSVKSEEVKHYKIKRDRHKNYHFNDAYKFERLSELIEHHKKKCSGLDTILTVVPIEKALIQGHWIIDEEKLKKGKSIGKGITATVYQGNLRVGISSKTVAVKELVFDKDRAVDIIREISTMAHLSHPNLVTFHGVSFKSETIDIVTEFMSRGDLRFYLERQQGVLRNDPEALHRMLTDVVQAMCYLEEQNIVHRDLAARNCLVSNDQTIKVCDFGLSRFLDEGFYQCNNKSMPIKWCAPEVLESGMFSLKSDVWSFGVFAWEVYSFGGTPYQGMSNQQVSRAVAKNDYRLSRPICCPQSVYDIMMQCWEKEGYDRPSFSRLHELLQHIQV